MTDDETVSNQVAAAPQPAQAAHGNAVVEWFWRGRTLAARRAASPEPGPRATLLARRAQQTADLARDLVAPSESEEPPLQGNPSELFRQASYWALCAIQATAGMGTAGTEYVESTWDALEESLLLRAAASPERVETLRGALYSGSFIYFAEQPDAEQLLLRAELGRLSDLLLAKFHERAHSLQEVTLQRVWRLGLPLLAVIGIAFGFSALGEARDLARDKPWQASSRWASSGCESPAQQCAESPGFFFHTNEEPNPWIEFDLAEVHGVSVVKIDNRQDCCTERAFPLTVEVSTDHKHWKEVARREEEFTHWTASFSSVKARWVRLKVHKTTNLHLDKVRIFP